MPIRLMGGFRVPYAHCNDHLKVLEESLDLGFDTSARFEVTFGPVRSVALYWLIAVRIK